MKTSSPHSIKDILANGLPRNEVFDVIPEASSRILDIGYGDGRLLLRLIYEKSCTQCYGIELRPQKRVEEHLAGAWNTNLMEEDLPDEFHGFFSWIILHDVLEHVYNPWKFLSKINKYLADDGKLIMVSPNAQYWEVSYALLNGNWPLGVHGYWNEDHIRWFTFKTFSELAIMAGLSINKAYLQYPERIHAHFQEYERFSALQGKPLLEFPPLNFPDGHMEDGLPFVSPTWRREGIKILFDTGSDTVFPYIMAIKIMLVCSKRGEPFFFDIAPGTMPKVRKQFYAALGKDALKVALPAEVKIQIQKDT